MLVGALVIAFSVLVPMMPGMSMAGMMDPKVVPPGWTYSPSTAAQRLPIVIMGVVGLLISRHLTAYQRSEEHTSELQSLMRISYAVFCLQKQKNNHTRIIVHVFKL